MRYHNVGGIDLAAIEGRIEYLNVALQLWNVRFPALCFLFEPLHLLDRRSQVDRWCGRYTRSHVPGAGPGDSGKAPTLRAGRCGRNPRTAYGNERHAENKESTKKNRAAPRQT